MIYIPEYFDLQELACPHIFKKFGKVTWQFFDPRLLKTLDWLRESLNKPIFVNSWQIGGSLDERGFRCIKCELVKKAIEEKRLYVSPHMTGQGADFDVKGMTPTEVRLWLGKHEADLPFAIRLEKNVDWVHLDVRDATTKPDQKIVYFNP